MSEVTLQLRCQVFVSQQASIDTIKTEIEGISTKKVQAVQRRAPFVEGKRKFVRHK